MPEVLLNEPIAVSGIKLLREAGFQVFERPAGVSLPELLQKNPQLVAVQAIVARAGKLTIADLKLFPELKIIARHGVGVDNLPLDYLKNRRIQLTYTPGINARSVAELTITLILSLLHRLPLSIATQQRQVGSLLTGKTIGLIGYGRIAQEVEELLQPFNVEILVWNHRPKKIKFGRQVTIDELLKQSQIVSLHIPATSQTNQFFSAKLLMKMRSDAILINTARGLLIKTDDLYDALCQGQLAGAAVDVFLAGTRHSLNDFQKLPNFLATPHIGAETQEILTASACQCAEEIKRFFVGKSALSPYWR
ncbi:NAD(P)-dependent oxidoreductase [Liquorilactobacillus sicerae]|uniref:NAD(P)-dependent oxidoreductase n=1 Tax=Liquorilactobacillus sicerae TaxID=1416943 RepID=UPI002480D1FD|nr:NAD(P)-dependent oxidoreductase [Liquorilactobacillus sicerae]